MQLKRLIVGCLIWSWMCPASLAAEREEVRRYLDTAKAHIRQHHYEEALQDFEQALKRDPENGRANSGMGNVYAALKQCEKGVPYLEKALAVDGNDETAIFGLGACYMDLQQHEKAIPYLMRIVKMRPDYAKASEILAVAYVRRGVVYGRQGHNGQAREAIQSALALFEKIGNTTRADEVKQMLKDIPE